MTGREIPRQAAETDGGWILRDWRPVFECPWFSVRQDDITLPNGDAIQYHTVDHPNWVMVLPLLEDGRVVMERIYRWPLKRWTLECPSGGLDGDTPEVGARRELEEETGYRAGRLEHLGRFAATDGHSNEEYDIFLATQLSADGRIAREPTEQLEIQLYALDELRDLVLRGELLDGPSALAVLLTAARAR